MLRCRSLPIIATLLAMWNVGVTRANVPDPAHCDVTPWDPVWEIYGCPYHPSCTGLGEVTIRVCDVNGNPVANSHVQIAIVWESGMRFCQQGEYDNLYTDSQGYVDFCFGFCGCGEEDEFNYVYADGVQIRRYWRARSSDWDGYEGDGVVNLMDMIEFSHERGAGDNRCCHNHTWYYGGGIGLDDVIIFSEAVLPAHYCQ